MINFRRCQKKSFFLPQNADLCQRCSRTFIFSASTQTNNIAKTERVEKDFLSVYIIFPFVAFRCTLYASREENFLIFFPFAAFDVAHISTFLAYCTPRSVNNSILFRVISGDLIGWRSGWMIEEEFGYRSSSFDWCGASRAQMFMFRISLSWWNKAFDFSATCMAWKDKKAQKNVSFSSLHFLNPNPNSILIHSSQIEHFPIKFPKKVHIGAKWFLRKSQAK